MKYKFPRRKSFLTCKKKETKLNFSEQFNYLKFYKKCKKILDDGKVSDKEIDDLEMHEAKRKSLAFTFGRFNPPTTGHELLVDKSFNLAKKLGAEHAIFTSKTNDPKKNPLSINDKIKFMKLSFPEHKNHIYHPDVIGIRTPAEVLEWLSENGYEELHFMVGSDRVKSFEGMINSMQKKGYTKFKRVVVVSAGERDPDSDDVSGMSASKMRGFVEKDDFDSFAKGTPMNSKDAKKMFDKLKEGMNLSESYITEVLKPSDSLEKWIKDFLKSDDPRFDGKSKKKRIEMATAAYYAAQE